MKRVVVIFALLLILPVLVVIAYFGRSLLKMPGSTRNNPVVAETAVPAETPLPPPNTGQKPPPVIGPVFQNEEHPGETVTKPFIEERSENTVEVRSGDTLHGIALKHYGDASYIDDILAANPGLSPNRLHPGQKIYLPPKPAPGSSTAKAASNEPKIYVVKQGETLVSIARKMYGDSAMYTAIFNLNRDQMKSPESVRPGMRLRMPPPPKY